MELQPYDVVDYRGTEGTVLAVKDTSVLVGYESGRLIANAFKTWECSTASSPASLFGMDVSRHVDFQDCVGPNAKWPFAYWVNVGYLIFRRHGVLSGVQAKANGCHCAKCHNHFPFAEPNQADGTLVCWNCRNYPYYKGRMD